MKNLGGALAASVAWMLIAILAFKTVTIMKKRECVEAGKIKAELCLEIYK